MKRIEREKRTAELMIRLYCRKKLGLAEPPAEYAELAEYARRRLDRCRFGEAKGSCRKCPIHCYAPEKRRLMREVMRWCGPRMVFLHPAAALRHFLGR